MHAYSGDELRTIATGSFTTYVANKVSKGRNDATKEAYKRYEQTRTDDSKLVAIMATHFIFADIDSIDKLGEHVKLLDAVKKQELITMSGFSDKYTLVHKDVSKQTKWGTEQWSIFFEELANSVLNTEIKNAFSVMASDQRQRMTGITTFFAHDQGAWKKVASHGNSSIGWKVHGYLPIPMNNIYDLLSTPDVTRADN